MPREQFQSLTEPMYYILMSLQDECCGVDITRQEGRKKWYRITEKGNDSLKKEYRRILAMARDGAAGLEGDRDAVLEMEKLWDFGYSGNGVLF